MASRSLARRCILKLGAAGLGGLAAFRIGKAFGQGVGEGSDPLAAHRELLSALPFQRIEVSGAAAYARWESLRKDGRGWPIIVGSDDELVALARRLAEAPAFDPAAILARADAAQYPRDLATRFELRSQKEAELDNELVAASDKALGDIEEVLADGSLRPLRPDEVRARVRSLVRNPVVGPWPDIPLLNDLAPSLVYGEEGDPHTRAHILLVPATSGSEVPAMLDWGRWLDCPSPELQVATLRNWQQDYGAELVGLSADTMDIRVTRRPMSRDVALDLAREQFAYCADANLQHDQNLSALAATLMADDWWLFWWDENATVGENDFGADEGS